MDYSEVPSRNPAGTTNRLYKPVVAVDRVASHPRFTTPGVPVEVHNSVVNTVKRYNFSPRDPQFRLSFAYLSLQTKGLNIDFRLSHGPRPIRPGLIRF